VGSGLRPDGDRSRARQNRAVQLAGREGNELELAVLGYQFPEVELDPWDSNWLLIGVRAVTPQGSWEVVDPCLTTWEAKRLVGWLVRAVGHAAEADPLQFTEPNLTVTAAAAPADPARVQLGFGLALELRPPWAGAVTGGDDLHVDLDVGRGEVARAAAALLGDLVRFPERGDPPIL